MKQTSHVSINNFKNEIANSDIYSKMNKDIDSDPNINYYIIHNILKSATKQHLAPKIVKFNKRRHKKSKWITQGIVKSNIRMAKRNYYYSLFKKYKYNIKNTWTNIKDLLQQSKVKRDFPNHFTINGEEITDSNIIANKFCKYFTDIGPSLTKNMKMPKNINVKDFLTGTHSCTFQFKQIDDISILRIINDLPNKSSTGFDDISMRLIKAIKTEIIPALLCIFNQSLNTGIFPEKLKIAKVIPIHKKGSLNDISNYRSISLLPSISKILEKLIFKQWSTYFNEHKLLYDSQYGFRAGHRLN